MTFKEFIQACESGWHTDPEHVFFGDPDMMRFLSPAELAQMMQAKAKHETPPGGQDNWKHKGVKRDQDPDLTMGVSQSPNKSTVTYQGGGIHQKVQTHTHDSDETQAGPSGFEKLAKSIEDIKQRLASLEAA